jgi:tetratricopeptide (TPR) repeat protein
LTATELNTVGRWRGKTEESVGKEVARFWKEKLDKNGFHSVINSVQRTSRWRLGTVAVDPHSVAELADSLRAKGWEQSAIQSPLELREFAEWVVAATGALMDLQLGEVDQAQRSAQKLILNTRDPILARIARIMGIRAIQRAGNSSDKAEIDIGDYDRVHSWGVGAVARAFHARAVALKKHWVRPADYEEEIDAIRHLILDAEAAGDIGAIGTLYGTLAVLNRRTGAYHEAEMALRRAIPLLIANGDVLSLQGALFNLGHLIERIVKTEGKYDYSLSLAMLQLDMDLREKFNLGNDSAQCEILMSLIHADMAPESTAAEELLGKAERIIEKNESAYDQACWNRAHAKLIYKRAEATGSLSQQQNRKEILKYLKKAVAWFDRADRPAEKKDTQKKLEMFEIKGKIW